MSQAQSTRKKKHENIQEKTAKRTEQQIHHENTWSTRLLNACYKSIFSPQSNGITRSSRTDASYAMKENYYLQQTQRVQIDNRVKSCVKNVQDRLRLVCKVCTNACKFAVAIHTPILLPNLARFANFRLGKHAKKNVNATEPAIIDKGT